MSRTPDQVLDELRALLPGGWAWPDGPDSGIAALLAPHANALSRLEGAADALLEQTDPRAADELLPDYERVLGPDPAGRYAVWRALDERRRIAYQRWTGIGGQSIAFFVALAASLGVAISIAERQRSQCGRARCGQVLAPSPAQFVWIVTLPTARVVNARCGAARAGQSIGAFTASLIEGVIRWAQPSHTIVVFSYTG